jgi:hypothetical protein
MNSSDLTVRGLYRTMSTIQTHLVQSSEIATTSTCPNLFKLSYPFGVSKGNRDFVVANTVHNVLSVVLPNIIKDNWCYKTKEFERMTRKIEYDSHDEINRIVIEKRYLADQMKLPIPHDFENVVRDRFHGLILGFVKRIMRAYQCPERALTEIIITNTRNFHEGRIDAILEFSHGRYGVIDWKTYNMDRTGSNNSAKWQLLVNMLLSNYRYASNEDDWSNCLFGAVIDYGNAYLPRLPVSEKNIEKLKDDRNFAHEVLCGRSPPVQKPYFCPVCDSGLESCAQSCNDCRFYRDDSELARNGMLPDNYNRVRRELLNKRYRVLEQRAETHRHKFVINTLIDKCGEQVALQMLAKAKMIYIGYELVPIDNDNPTLLAFESKRSIDEIPFLDPRKEVRIIGREDSKPLLACVNVQGVVKQIDFGWIMVDTREATAARRARKQLSGLPIIIIHDEINLTRRILEPMHRFHKLAADIMLPEGLLPDILFLIPKSGWTRRSIIEGKCDKPCQYFMWDQKPRQIWFINHCPLDQNLSIVVAYLAILAPISITISPVTLVFRRRQKRLFQKKLTQIMPLSQMKISICRAYKKKERL